MAESKIYRRVSTAGMAEDPAYQRHHPNEQFWWRVHVQSCSRRGIANLLTIDEFAEIGRAPCHLCGAEPTTRAVPTGRSALRTNGIDRVDNTRPYSTSNCAPCCKTCNAMKSGLSVSDFLAHISRVVAFRR